MTPPDNSGGAVVAAAGHAADHDAESLHFRALERLYNAAPVNQLFESEIAIYARGRSRIRFLVREDMYHGAGAAHGTLYFKMLDDAAFYAANSLVSDRFLLTTSFNLHFTKPARGGEVIAEGRWVSGKRRVLVAEARLIDAEGDEIGRGTGTFMRSHIRLAGLEGYNPAIGGGVSPSPDAAKDGQAEA